MYDIKYTLHSLLHQSLKPDKVILWLAEEQFPNKEADLAPSLLALKESGLSIMWCEDIKSYKKLIPALECFPDDIIVTADDDIYYPENWLELLYNSYLDNPDCIHCHRGHKIKLSGNSFAPYQNWEQKVTIDVPTYHAFPTGCGGVLYPPHALFRDVVNRELFMKLAPNADDVWFWTMSVLNSTKIQIIQNGTREVNYVNYAREIGLYHETTLASKNTGAAAGNDKYLQNVLSAYPQLSDILLSDSSEHFSSAKYWETRYLKKETSGAGSYSNLAEFKAKIINQFVWEHNINLVIEWGCGDGNQLKLAQYPQYVGFDVSHEAVNICQKEFQNDASKTFIWSGSENFSNNIVGDLAMSLDVIYHLVEDEVYELYMQRLFESSSKYVCIYSCNFEKAHAQHVRCRKFTDYVEQHIQGWKLMKVVPNEYPYDEKNPNHTSWSDFYFYEKVPV